MIVYYSKQKFNEEKGDVMKLKEKILPICFGIGSILIMLFGASFLSNLYFEYFEPNKMNTYIKNQETEKILSEELAKKEDELSNIKKKIDLINQIIEKKGSDE